MLDMTGPSLVMALVKQAAVESWRGLQPRPRIGEDESIKDSIRTHSDGTMSKKMPSAVIPLQ